MVFSGWFTLPLSCLHSITIFRQEFVGKYASLAESTKHGINVDLPVFMYVMEKENVSEEYKKYLLAINESFMNNYE